MTGRRAPISINAFCAAPAACIVGAANVEFLRCSERSNPDEGFLDLVCNIPDINRLISEFTTTFPSKFALKSLIHVPE
jgi:hypothetical protein